jgi:hypothetical protein
MKRLLTGLLALALPTAGAAAPATGPAGSPLGVAAANRFAALTPAFYGCYDWHSSVHGHWLLARLARSFPDAEFATSARGAGAQPDAREHRDGGRVSAWSGPGIVRTALWPGVAAATRGRTAHLGRSAGARVGQGAVATRDRVGAANHGLAAQAQLSDPLGRTRPDRFCVRIDLGLGRGDRGRRHDPAARPSQPDLLGTFAVYLATGAGLRR